MSYKFATENINYEDYSSGRVLFNQHGTTSFPVRLTSEIFQRCENILNEGSKDERYTIYDPCCGGAYLLTTIGYLHGNKVLKLYGSDVDEGVIPLAKKNLSLLTISGLNERIDQINKMILDYNKASHREALQSALKLKKRLGSRTHIIDTDCFVCDATKDTDMKNTISNFNIVITDLPYGDVVQWNDGQEQSEAIKKLLNNLLPKLAINSVVAIISTKKTVIKHEKYERIEHFNLGKRQVVFLRPINF
jgi:hypothetical protein